MRRLTGARRRRSMRRQKRAGRRLKRATKRSETGQHEHEVWPRLTWVSRSPTDSGQLAFQVLPD